MSIPKHRIKAAERIQEETGVRVEPLDNQNLFPYLVECRTCINASKARKLARIICDQRREDLGQPSMFTKRQKG